MNPILWAALFFTVCGQSFDVMAPVPVVEEVVPWSSYRMWYWLNNQEDLIARTILAEAGGLVLDPDRAEDAYGVGWVVWNRTRPGSPFDYAWNDVSSAVVAPGQFLAMRARGNSLRAADPVKYSAWYGATPNAGRWAYWLARGMAHCITSGEHFDPTHGALFFASAKYKRDALGELVHGIDGRLELDFYADGRLRFRRESAGPNWKLNTSAWVWLIAGEQAEGKR